MKKHRYSLLWALLIIVVILVVDQGVKIWVKTHMHLGDSICITRWFYITFVENNGMAYGMSFIYKPLLTLFRIVAVAAIGYYTYKVLRRASHSIGYMVCLSMIVAGAAGNIFDCFFYGQMFTVSTPYLIAEPVPFGEGYAPLLQGRVVDMFYFPLIVTTYPDWFPLWGGEPFIFFSPVFNVADACISVGVVMVLLFYRKQLEKIAEVLSGKAQQQAPPEEKHDDDA